MLNFFSKRYSKQLLLTCRHTTYTTTHLEGFIKRYFNPYTFIIPKDSPTLNDFSSILFRVNKTHQTDRSLYYSVIPHFDPGISFIQDIISKTSLDISFRVFPYENDFYVFSSSLYLPTHFSLRIRDEFENQGIRTFTTMNDAILNKTTLTEDPFEPKLNTSNNFSQILTCWAQLSKNEQKNIMNKFRHKYYDIFFEDNLSKGSTHNTPEFEVHDVSWNLDTARDHCFYDNKINANNAVIKLIEFSKTRHSSVKGYRGSATTCGALWINTDCPGIDYLNKYYHDLHLSATYDRAMRHTRSDGYDLLYGYNGYIPYWMKIYLYESLIACGIDVKNLHLPNEMNTTNTYINRYEF